MKFLCVFFIALVFGRIQAQSDISDTLEDLGLTTLLEVLTDNDLIDTLEGLPEVTLFAPTNEAIDNAGNLPDGQPLVDLLTFHAIAAVVDSSAIENELLVASVFGEEIRFNIYQNGTIYTCQGAPIDLSQVDVEVSNGFIHVIDGVMRPPMGTIANFVAENPDFSTLLAALEAADLVDALDEEGPFTVFAPDNDAFANVPEDDLNDLLNNTEALTDVLLYHGVGATAYSVGLADGDSFESLQGDAINIVIEDGVFINSTDYAQVIIPDVSVSNGVIHAINRVLKVPVIEEEN